MKSQVERQSNMLDGNLWTNIFLFAMPLAATGILQQLFNAADIAIVGRFTKDLGPIAMAAVGANSPIISLLLNFFVGISLGTNVVIANAIGSNHKKTIHAAISTSIIVALAGGLFLALAGQTIVHPLLSSLNVPEEVMEMASLYLRIYLIGMPVILLYNFEAAIFRSAGDTKTPLFVLTISGLLNVVLNLIFVILFGMAVEGVAIATVASNGLSSIILLVKLFRSKSDIRLDWKKFEFNWNILVRILRIGLPAGCQSAVFSIANIIIQGAMNSLGTFVMAASSAALNIEIFAFNVLASFGQACTTFVGQNYGANQITRCKQILKISYIECVCLTFSAIILIMWFGKDLLAIFNSDPEVIEIGYQRMMIIFPAYLFTSTYELISGYLRGFGISLLPAVLTSLTICVSRIGWVMFVFPLAPNFTTIMTIFPISLGLAALSLICAVFKKKPVATILSKEELLSKEQEMVMQA